MRGRGDGSWAEAEEPEVWVQSNTPHAHKVACGRAAAAAGAPPGCRRLAATRQLAGRRRLTSSHDWATQQRKCEGAPGLCWSSTGTNSC